MSRREEPSTEIIQCTDIQEFLLNGLMKIYNPATNYINLNSTLEKNTHMDLQYLRFLCIVE